MKRPKRADLKKLSIDATTIRILTDTEQKTVVGGAPTIRTTSTCSWAPLTCP